MNQFISEEEAWHIYTLARNFQETNTAQKSGPLLAATTIWQLPLAADLSQRDIVYLKEIRKILTHDYGDIFAPFNELAWVYVRYHQSHTSFTDRDPFEWETGHGIVVMILTGVIWRYANSVASIACEAFDKAYKIREIAERCKQIEFKGLYNVLQRSQLLAWDDVFIQNQDHKLIYYFADFIARELPKIDKMLLAEDHREFILAIYIYYEFLRGGQERWVHIGDMMCEIISKLTDDMNELDALTDLKGALLYSFFCSGRSVPRHVTKEVSTYVMARYGDIMATREQKFFEIRDAIDREEISNELVEEWEYGIMEMRIFHDAFTFLTWPLARDYKNRAYRILWIYLWARKRLEDFKDS